jgi:hypothetical protein
MPVIPLRVDRPAADVRAATIAALAAGAVLHTPTYATWDVQGACQFPRNVEQAGTGHFQSSPDRQDKEWQQGRTLSMMVPCRKCEGCLKARAWRWGKRAVAEWEQSPRTWFGTLTFSPEERFRLIALTRQRFDAVGVTFEKMSPVERYSELHRTMGPLVTRFIKRLRKGAKASGFEPLSFRYLLAVEPHKDWVPHYHMLVHEVSDTDPVRKKALERPWPHGFTQWRLVKDSKQAFYAAKYLRKYSIARVRASECYGEAEEHDLSSQAPRAVNTHRPPKHTHGAGPLGPALFATEGTEKMGPVMGTVL